MNAPQILLFFHDRAESDVVDLSHDGRPLQAVGEHVLAIHDRLRARQARENGLLGHVEQERVTARHGVEEDVQLEVLGERSCVRRELALEVEIIVLVHQEGFHRAMRLPSLSYVRPYFSAIAAA